MQHKAHKVELMSYESKEKHSISQTEIHGLDDGSQLRQDMPNAITLELSAVKGIVRCLSRLTSMTPADVEIL